MLITLLRSNPICGPFVPGRKALNQAGVFETVVSGAQFVDIGGDGLLNCDTASQCHIPLTATVKHGDKSIQVKIVDRCEACAIGDIDQFVAKVRFTWPFLGDTRADRMAHAYGSLIGEMLGDVADEAAMGADLGGGLTELELRWMRDREWARSADDALYDAKRAGRGRVATASPDARA